MSVVIDIHDCANCEAYGNPCLNCAEDLKGTFGPGFNTLSQREFRDYAHPTYDQLAYMNNAWVWCVRNNVQPAKKYVAYTPVSTNMPSDQPVLTVQGAICDQVSANSLGKSPKWLGQLSGKISDLSEKVSGLKQAVATSAGSLLPPGPPILTRQFRSRYPNLPDSSDEEVSDLP
jgi:hypothetical protein